MEFFSRKPPWYAFGLAFECQQCGRCCAGPEEGYVWADTSEISDIAAFLGISELDLHRNYLRRVGRRYTLVEDATTHDCICLKPNALGGKSCSIYSVRPAQCRTWPFWPANLQSPDAWARAGMRCVGINRGKRFNLDDIQQRLDLLDE